MSDTERDPLDRYLAEETQPLPPLGFDGGFLPARIEVEPVPEATPETMICLRDCRHYVEIRTRFGHSNARGTLEREPIQVNRYCRALQEMDLTDELVRDCSEWDPREPDGARLARQKAWRDAHG